MTNELTEIKQDQIDIELKAIFNFLKQNTVEKGMNYHIEILDKTTIKFSVTFFSKSSIIYKDDTYNFHKNSRDITFINLADSTKKYSLFIMKI